MWRRFCRKFATNAVTRPGDKISGFVIDNVRDVPSLDLNVTLLTHESTGAKHLHVQRDDSNNVFAIGFKTLPPDATGVPHILEHTTLCGSEKYAVRDPFFKMLNRSLANFMNAMTASDYTFYPFATTNSIDFSNLMDVYLDATLHPLLRELDFKQEGWRLEHMDNTDMNSPLILKGVVYNEMKGQMSDSSYLFYIRFQESIFPSLNNSGGDPLYIPNLTHKQLVDFHHSHYHPSNAKSFTYGSFPLINHLEKLDSAYSTFSPLTPETSVRSPIPLNSSVEVFKPGPFDPMMDQNAQEKLSISWYAGDPADHYSSFCLRIACSLLLDGHAAPMYQALIDSQLAADFSPNTGFDSTMRTNILSIGVVGASADNVDNIKKTISGTMAEVIDIGFSRSRIDGVLHQLDISRKGSKPDFGMSLLYSITGPWFNDVNPIDIIDWSALVERFKVDLDSNPRLLQDILAKYCAPSAPSFFFRMNPSEKFEEEQAHAEAEQLRSKTHNLSESEKKEIYDMGLKILEHQSQPEDTSVLPTLKVSDIPRKPEISFEHEEETIGGVSNQWNIVPANGLVYARGLVDITNIPTDLIPYLGLYTAAFTSFGTKDQSMADLEDEIKLKTGGISFSARPISSPYEIGTAQLALGMSAYALKEKTDDMFGLLERVTQNTDFRNYEKLWSLITMSVADASNTIAERGHTYARGLATSKLTTAGVLNEKISGASQFAFLKKILDRGQDRLEDVSKKLEEIHKFVMNASTPFKTSITCESNARDDLGKSLQKFISNCGIGTKGNTFSAYSDISDFGAHPDSTKMLLNMPYQVSYGALAVLGAPYTHEDGAALQILSSLLTHKYLHPEIREKGGAYGGGATYAGVGGTFSFYSYRDPNPENTYKVMNKGWKVGSDREWSDIEIEEAKLTVFQGVDAPRSISDEGMIYFMDGISDEMRQKRREQLLDVTKSDVQRVSEKYLKAADLQAASPTDVRSCVFIGPNSDWAKDWNVIELEGLAESAKY
ncbi:hypothetical protein CANCADRAFT_31592 [Tortispora caseinolytica NRRL Y-17796]|uniref:Presequence protease, mitochondrial n=1 Tax=Tortispora caseinolytica NRRL Y-17796 TaxID=767744 RepID=A0A1E4TGB5_9ASCO|nr:hypothetical protein CANCADRAFT_31592 [Tortispora caseinolytica NRRL Y-17796]